MISLQQLTKVYGNGTAAVTDLSLDVGPGELCMLLGPSGCGKTTVLKMINRLIEPTSGRIIVGGEDVTDARPVELRRRIGYVIQQVGLFPHMTVGENVATVPRLLGWKRNQIEPRVRELLDLVGLDSAHANRYPHQLSGGQQQRVGVARSLGADPPVLLMDEPFGAIDPITRGRLQEEFQRLQSELHKTVVFVTHDVDEAILLGDRIALLKEGGVLAQYDPPAELLSRPKSPFVEEFLGGDRGLKALGVTGIDGAALEPAVVVAAGERGVEVASQLEAVGAQMALVRDSRGHVEGWVTAADLNGDVVGSNMRRGVATVASTASLKDALRELLAHPGGWVAVIDGETDGEVVGIFTPASLHAALPRDGDAVR
jgi:osmoprotectant transport system ATP-binding protein